jgi:Flp pilus assembly protein TadG
MVALARAVRRRQSRRGQALAEFAIVAPLFFLLLFSIVEVGRFVFAYEVANNAVREGTRYAIVHGSNSLSPVGPSTSNPDGACPPSVNTAAVTSLVQHDAYTLATATDILACWPDGTNLRGNRVSVSADFPWQPLIDFQINFFGVQFNPLPSINIHAESTLVINN